MPLVEAPAPQRQDSRPWPSSCATGVVAPGLARGQPATPPLEPAARPGHGPAGGFAAPEKLDEGRSALGGRASRQRHRLSSCSSQRRAGLLEHMLGDLLVGSIARGNWSRFARRSGHRVPTGWDGWVDSEAGRRPPGCAGAAPLPAPHHRAQAGGVEGTSGDEAAEDEEPPSHGPVTNSDAHSQRARPCTNRRVRQIRAVSTGSARKRTLRRRQRAIDGVAVFSLLSSSRQMTEAASSSGRPACSDRDAPDGELMRLAGELQRPGSTPRQCRPAIGWSDARPSTTP